MDEAITSRFSDDNMNPLRPNETRPTIYRSSALSSGGHASTESAYGEKLQMASSLQIDEMTEEEMMNGLDDPEIQGGKQLGFARYLTEQGGGFEEEGSYDDNDSYDSYDGAGRNTGVHGTNQGPGEGHKPVNHALAGNLQFKQKVYVASLDQTAVVYETEGDSITVKASDGQFYDVDSSDVQTIATNRPIMERTNPGQGQPDSADRPYNGLPRSRNMTDHPGISDVREESDTLMNSFADDHEDDGLSYSERRRAKRRR